MPAPKGLESFRFEVAFSFAGPHRDKMRAIAEIVGAAIDPGNKDRSGECHLRRADVAQLVENNFRQHSGECCGSQSRAPEHAVRYELRAWVVMPNHVHVFFKVGTVPMSEIVGAWKKHTGRLANKLLGKQGALWAEDYFDIFMRDAEHERKTTCYIENNPTKAKLVLDPETWLWSSARLRDEFGNLTLPR